MPAVGVERTTGQKNRRANEEKMIFELEWQILQLSEQVVPTPSRSSKARTVSQTQFHSSKNSSIFVL